MGIRLLVFAWLMLWLLPAMAQTTKSDIPQYNKRTASGNRSPIIEYYGDSTVWGYASRTGERVSEPAPAAFAKALPKSRHYEVRNEGVNGSTACGLLNGTDGKHPQWQTQMAASTATYVILNHAINDQWKYDVNTYRSCLGALARIAKQHGKHVIFETPNPTRDSGSEGLDVYVNAMRETAILMQVPVIDQYGYLMDYLGSKKPETICPDGLHPSQEVYRLKGRYAATVFIQLTQ